MEPFDERGLPPEKRFSKHTAEHPNLNQGFP